MHKGQYIFTQITRYLPTRYFERLVNNSNDRTKGWALSHWSHMLVLMFGQLLGCRSLRELTDITIAHGKKSYFLGFGKTPINRQMLSKANSIRDYKVFEEYAFYMVRLAQEKRLTKEFELHGKFYAVDSTTIDLCMSVFKWAKFRSTKSGVKIHTQVDIVTQIPIFYRISNANVHDVNAMDWLPYEALACYVFDRGYFDLARLFHIEESNAFFIIREKKRPAYEIVFGDDLLDGTDNVLRDQTIRFTGKRNRENYPSTLRRIVYYAPDLCRTFTYYTNNFELEAKDIALLYRYRWQVELFFKWIKQHLRVKTFWGETDNAVRLQIHIAIITYCLVGIIEEDLHLERPIVEVMRILSSALLCKEDMLDLFIHSDTKETTANAIQLCFDF